MVPESDATPECAKLDMHELPQVEARVRKKFNMSFSPAKLVVDWGCDVAVGELRDVVLEIAPDADGLRNLRIVWFHRAGDRFVVRTLDLPYFASTFELREAAVDATIVEKTIARSRVALMAEPHLVRLVDPSSPFGLGDTEMSSKTTIHLLVAIADDRGHVTRRSFTGVDSTRDQEQYLPLRLAIAPVEALLNTLHFTPGAATAEVRRFFTERLVLAGRYDRRRSWVGNHYVAHADALGTIDAVPALVELAADDASLDRFREEAIAAIAAITGWNPRIAPDGSLRTLDEAAAAALRECRLE